MDFKKFDEIIKENKYNMLFFEIYYNLTCNNDLKLDELTQEQKEKIIFLIHDAYLKDENFTDLAHICDVLVENLDDALNDNLTKWDLLNKSYIVF